jgi:hypothetical protein
VVAVVVGTEGREQQKQANFSDHLQVGIVGLEGAAVYPTRILIMSHLLNFLLVKEPPQVLQQDKTIRPTRLVVVLEVLVLVLVQTDVQEQCGDYEKYYLQFLCLSESSIRAGIYLHVGDRGC